MNRQGYLTLADAAAQRAASLAREAEKAARGDGPGRALAEPLAAAGQLWAAVSQARSDIAAAMTDTDDVAPEA